MSKSWSVRVQDDVWSIIEGYAAQHQVSAAEAMSALVKRGHSQPDAAQVLSELSELKEMVKTVRTEIYDRSIFNAEITGTSSGGVLGKRSITLSVKKSTKPNAGAAAPRPPR